MQDSKELLLNRVDSSEKDIKVRRGFDIPPEEKEFLLKRKKVVANALQEVLGLHFPLDPSEVPTVAVLCSGGGSRAMTGTYGSLKGLQSLGLLDVITYMTSVSGSTWTFASLYTDNFWSKENLDEAIASKQKELSKWPPSLVSIHQLSYYRSELDNREEEGYPVSFADFWGLVIEYLIFGKKHTETLSDQKTAVSEGQNPLPIYTAVRMDERASADHDWCEFTPFEVGFFKYGAFVPAEDFGSEFNEGHVIKKLPETRIPFLFGIWSSFFANLSEIWEFFQNLVKQTRAQQQADCANSISDILTLLKEVLNEFVYHRPVISSMYNFLTGLPLHNSSNFNTSLDTDLNDLYLHLVDSANTIDIAFLPVLQPHRRADIILSLNYSLETSHLQDLKKTQKYCIDHKIPFPKIDFSKYSSQPKEEVYVFMDEKNPDAPIVLHFPLVNVLFKDYKAPEVERTEMELGEEELTNSILSPYNRLNLTYTPEDFQHLVDVTYKNIVNNKDTIINALKILIEKKK